jgi:hypothetical protein
MVTTNQPLKPGMQNLKDTDISTPPGRYLCFDLVVGLVWSNAPESYAGSSIATGRTSHARQVKGDDPRKRDTLGLYVGGWAWGSFPPIKKLLRSS